MDSLSVVLCFVIGLISFVLISFKKRFAYWKDRGAAYVEPTIPFGNLPIRQVHFIDTTDPIYKQKKPGYPFMGAYFFRNPVVIPTDLDFIQNILVKDFSYFHERGMYVNEEDDPLSAHMFSLDGDKWKSLRGKLSPTFTSGKMKFMFPTVVDVADRFNSTLSEILETESELELRDLLARFTTDVIGTCAFGIECNSLKNPNCKFRNYGAKIFDEPLHGPLVHLFLMLYPNVARKLHLRFFRKEVEDFFMGVVRETIDYREKNNVRRKDFMDLLIQLKNGVALDEHAQKLGRLTFEEIVAQAFVFFAAGFETSSTTMLFSLYELALNPDIQEKARQEIETVLMKYEGKLTYEAVKEMVYVDQIITESLRKYPPVVNLIRQPFKDYRVPGTKIILEKGTSVFIPVYSIHHDPEIFPNPDVFDPDRFTPEQIKSRHPMSFLGFGEGPRNCIGLRFGRMQSRIGLITLLKNYRLKPCAKTPIPMVFAEGKPILSPKLGVHLQIEKL
ncbi:probable cytochrome P450 6a14 [Hermetia illucens]|uniref:probable cytochrome P450 6a14 n=1 Tax=Hermetia illucens TaxID=343691 RepID=UPI0018CC2BAB|nr:probable cytochrome P450 6a14 [Hermetia illucens]